MSNPLVGKLMPTFNIRARGVMNPDDGMYDVHIIIANPYGNDEFCIAHKRARTRAEFLNIAEEAKRKILDGLKAMGVEAIATDDDERDPANRPTQPMPTVPQ